jgi:hypothetical protein
LLLLAGPFRLSNKVAGPFRLSYPGTRSFLSSYPDLRSCPSMSVLALFLSEMRTSPCRELSQPETFIRGIHCFLVPCSKRCIALPHHETREFCCAASGPRRSNGLASKERNGVSYLYKYLHRYWNCVLVVPPCQSAKVSCGTIEGHREGGVLCVTTIQRRCNTPTHIVLPNSAFRPVVVDTFKLSNSRRTKVVDHKYECPRRLTDPVFT